VLLAGVLWGGALPAPASAAVVDDLVLGVGASSSERRVSWFSAARGEQQVQVVRASASTTEAFPSSSATTVRSASGSAYASGQRWHHATLRALEPDSRYLYLVGSASGGWSAVHAFTTEGDDGGFRFLVVGDPQIGASGSIERDRRGWRSTLAEANGQVPDAAFLISLGDQVEHEGNAAEYDALLSNRWMRRVPVSATIGNHDVPGAAHLQHFARPHPSATGGHWFEHDGALVVTLNSNADVGETRRFLRRVVQRHGSAASWVVVAMHHSPFGGGRHARDENVVALRRTLAPEFARLGVDLVLAGHEHGYTRSYLMAGPAPVTGTGGPELVPASDEVLYVTAGSSSGSKYYPQGERRQWVAERRQPAAGTFAEVQVTGQSLTMTTYRARDRHVVDRVMLSHRS
jgi:hypothetical protein